MNAISSHRPLADSPAIALNQLAAKTTWNNVFKKIIYFNEHEPRMEDEKTFFVSFKGKPPIWELATCAAMASGWTAILNADILIEQRAVALEAALDRVHAKCGFSFRIPCGKTAQEDMGLDFFFATPEVWNLVALNIPKEFTLGRVIWDTWTLSFFTAHFHDYCFDVSPSRLIYHPIHGERIDQNVQVSSPYLEKVRWPKHSLKI